MSDFETISVGHLRGPSQEPTGWYWPIPANTAEISILLV